MSERNPFRQKESPTHTPKLSGGYKILLLVIVIALALSVSGGASARWDDERTWPPNCDPGLPLIRCYTPGDYDGDQKADLAIFRPAEGFWHVKRSSNNEPYAIHWGQSGDKLVPADYDGDRKDDFAVYRPPTANSTEKNWYVHYSDSDSWDSHQLGDSESSPAPADYDGDGKADFAVVWPGGVYRIHRSSDDACRTYYLPTVNRNEAELSNHNDIVVPGDYDGDGVADPAIYDERPEELTNHSGPRVWVIRRSSDEQVISVPLGEGEDVPVPGDYNGDGKTDIAVWRPKERRWSIIENLDAGLTGHSVREIIWGRPDDMVAPADYDGDGKTDLAVWRPVESTWYILYSRSNKSDAHNWGLNSDIPVPMSLKRELIPHE